MKDKKKELAAVKQTSSKRKAEAKRQLKDKQKGTKNQELFLRFLDAHPEVPATLATSETLWAFIRWLEQRGYSIIHADTVFCVPFSHLADYSKLL